MLYQRWVLVGAESESAAHDGELPIDGSVGRPCRPALRDVLPHLRRAEPGYQQAAQHRLDMRLVPPPHVVGIAQLAELIILHHHQRAEIGDSRALRSHTPACRDFADAML